MTVALEGGEWSAVCPGHNLPPGKTWYPLYGRLGGPQGRSGWAENLVPTGIWSQSRQSVVNRYTNWANRTTVKWYVFSINHETNRRQKGVTFIYNVTTLRTQVQDTVNLAPVLHHSFPVNHVQWYLSQRVTLLLNFSANEDFFAIFWTLLTNILVDACANIKQHTWTVGPFHERSSINFGQIFDFSFSKETEASYWRRGDLPWINFKNFEEEE